MSKSLSHIYIHLVFSTKLRSETITDLIRPELHSYMCACLQNLGCAPVLMNSTKDHVHILFDLSRTVSLSQVIKEVKQASSLWFKTKGFEHRGFSWQAGYGAFSVSSSHVEVVKNYIENQQDHHRKTSFMDEFRTLLVDNGIAFDEKYLWD